MKIVAVESIPVSIPRLPNVNILIRTGITIPNAEFVIVRIQTDEGIEGLGEAPLEIPWTGEDWVISKHCIDHFLAPLLVDQSPLDVQQLSIRMGQAIPWHYYSKAAVEMALWDIVGKVCQQPVFTLLGGRVQSRVAVKFVASAATARETAEIAVTAAQSGFRTIKLKTGFRADQDIVKVREVRKALGDQIAVSIDSNGGWTVLEAVSALKELEECHLVFAEQPVPASNPAWMAHVHARSSTPIAAHESLRSVSDAIQALKYDLADIWCVTPSNHGGLLPTRQILNIADAQGIPCLIGGTVELTIATAALVHLAVASSGLGGELYPSDITGPLYHAGDVTQERITIKEGYVYPPEGPGLGVTIDEAALAHYRID